MKYILGLIVFISVGVLVVSILALVVLSKIAIAILLGLAPIFIVAVLFNFTNKMFETWLQQLINFTLVIIFTYAISAFFITLVTQLLGQLIQRGEEITFGDVAPLSIISIVLGVLLKQVPGIASALAGGAQVGILNSIGNAGSIVSNLHRGSGTALRQGASVINKVAVATTRRANTVRR